MQVCVYTYIYIYIYTCIDRAERPPGTVLAFRSELWMSLYSCDCTC